MGEKTVYKAAMNGRDDRMTKGGLLSRCFDNLRFLFALVLVLFHTFAQEATTQFSFSAYPLTASVKRVVDAFFLGDSIVAVYFFISGYLFFAGRAWSWAVYGRKLQNRIHTLLIPYLLWNLLAIALVAGKSLPCFASFLSYEGTDVDWSWSNVLSCFWMYDGQLSAPPVGTEGYEAFVQVQPYPINTALWFVRDLMIVSLFAPLWRVLLNKARGIFLTALAAAYVVMSYKVIDWHINQLLMATFFFSWGAGFSLRSEDVTAHFQRRHALFIVLYLLCSLGLMFQEVIPNGMVPLLKVVHTWVAVAFSFNLIYWMTRKGQLGTAALSVAMGCFIYMSHCLVVPRLLKVLAVVWQPEADAAWLTLYLTAAVVTVGLLVGCFVVCKRIAPALLGILIGRF